MSSRTVRHGFVRRDRLAQTLRRSPVRVDEPPLRDAHGIDLGLASGSGAGRSHADPSETVPRLARPDGLTCSRSTCAVPSL